MRFLCGEELNPPGDPHAFIQSCGFQSGQASPFSSMVASDQQVTFSKSHGDHTGDAGPAGTCRASAGLPWPACPERNALRFSTGTCLSPGHLCVL